ncbi:MAG: nuclear transport factor 2 family protein [Bacteroidota bacterium]|nr:nuclear transport factor 2 family protein [Bacteroidota bacterium]
MKALFLIMLAFALGTRPGTAQTVPTPRPVPAEDAELAVRHVLARYQQAVEKLDTTGTDRLFAPNSVVLETGSKEGTYRHYAAHHLAPELKEFSSFKYGDYEVDVTVDGPYAFAVETYTYTIGLKKDPKMPIKRRGVATSVLRKSPDGTWQIINSHNSARK